MIGGDKGEERRQATATFNCQTSFSNYCLMFYYIFKTDKIYRLPLTNTSNQELIVSSIEEFQSQI